MDDSSRELRYKLYTSGSQLVDIEGPVAGTDESAEEIKALSKQR